MRGSFWGAVERNRQCFEREATAKPGERDDALCWLRELDQAPTHPDDFWRRRPTLVGRLSAPALAHLQFLARHT